MSRKQINIWINPNHIMRVQKHSMTQIDADILGGIRVLNN